MLHGEETALELDGAPLGTWGVAVVCLADGSCAKGVACGVAVSHDGSYGVEGG
jgi:hypothetical protein